ncbi:MAG: hypothetical protein JSV97_10240 [candidate division WOR-3 bacterium]|nr:MAG: hypothetical protein JSV97_10240 [candidate division WOR-3 bacterium]
MAFLDNSGDIILDAVLTDTGRLRLAKGDGSFNITKFALGDDEINYELYDKNNASGSAYYDIEILQTPVLEAFTNNTSLLKSKLLSISRTNLLYLPEIRNNATEGVPANETNNFVSVAVDEATVTSLEISNVLPAGIINGFELDQNNADTRRLLFDQGIVSNALGDTGKVALDADLVETQYIIEIDNRLGYLADPDGNQATPSFVDDDNIASYFLSLTTNSEYFSDSTLTSSDVLAGPAGYRLRLLVGASTNLNSSTYLFTQLGSTSAIGSTNLYHIDTTIRVTGATTGFRVDIPIRFLKQQ